MTQNAPVGYEIAFFNIKSGVDEAQLKAAANAMDTHLLSKADGFIDHLLIKLTDKLYADIAIAASKQQAIDICASWTGDAHAEAFLALIEPIQFDGLDVLNFGEIIHGH